MNDETPLSGAAGHWQPHSGTQLGRTAGLPSRPQGVRETLRHESRATTGGTKEAVAGPLPRRHSRCGPRARKSTEAGLDCDCALFFEMRLQSHRSKCRQLVGTTSADGLEALDEP